MTKPSPPKVDEYQEFARAFLMFLGFREIGKWNELGTISDSRLREQGMAKLRNSRKGQYNRLLKRDIRADRDRIAALDLAIDAEGLRQLNDKSVVYVSGREFKQLSRLSRMQDPTRRSELQTLIQQKIIRQAAYALGRLKEVPAGSPLDEDTVEGAKLRTELESALGRLTVAPEDDPSRGAVASRHGGLDGLVAAIACTELGSLLSGFGQSTQIGR